MSSPLSTTLISNFTSFIKPNCFPFRVYPNNLNIASSLTSQSFHLSKNNLRLKSLNGVNKTGKMGFGLTSSGGGSGGNGGGDGGGGDNGEGGGDEKKGLLVSWYLAALKKSPVLTTAFTTALLNCVGDLICQLLFDKVSTVDIKRTLLFTFLGFTLVGPTLHFWYLNLSKMITIPGAPGTVLRLLLDQFLFSPIFVGVFLSAVVTLEGKPSQVVPKLQQEWISAVIANWQLWIPFQFLNFQFVPQQFQVLAANVVALAWNVILSYKAHKEVVMK